MIRSRRWVEPVEQRLEDNAWRSKTQRRDSQPIQTTLAERAPLCQDMGTQRIWSKTTTIDATRGAETDSRMANKSST